MNADMRAFVAGSFSSFSACPLLVTADLPLHFRECATFTLFREAHEGQPGIGRERARGATTASDIEGPRDLDWVGICLEAEIPRCALNLHMAQQRSNRLQIASSFPYVESLRPA